MKILKMLTLFIFLIIKVFAYQLIPKIYLEPSIPRILIRNYFYNFTIRFSLNSNHSNLVNDSNILYLLTAFHSNPSHIGFIKKNVLYIYSNKAKRTGIYNYTIQTDLFNRELNGYQQISFFLLSKSDIHTNLRDFYFRKISTSVIFKLILYPAAIRNFEFYYRMVYDKNTFSFKNDSLILHVHRNITNVYRVKLMLYNKFPKNSVVGIWRIYIILIDYYKMRQKLTDEEMDAGVIYSEFQVDYNDPKYRKSTYDPFKLPAHPNSPRSLVTFFPDIFNKSSISLPHILMILWIILLLGLIIITLYFGNCQHFFWVPLDREIVEIDPLDKSAGFGVCFFDFWLNLVGHDKDEEHCFFDMWFDKFGSDFPNTICRNCIGIAAQLIADNRLVELTKYDFRKDCVDSNCQFPFFKRQLGIYDNRIPGFDCVTCTKEAYIELLRASYAFTQVPVQTNLVPEECRH